MPSELHHRAKASISTRTEASGIPVIAVCGEVDLSNCEAFEAAIGTALDFQPARLILDLSGVSFMDSSGLNVLIRSASTGTSIQLRNPSPLMRRVIDVTGLANVLPVIS